MDASNRMPWIIWSAIDRNQNVCVCEREREREREKGEKKDWECKWTYKVIKNENRKGTQQHFRMITLAWKFERKSIR